VMDTIVLDNFAPLIVVSGLFILTCVITLLFLIVSALSFLKSKLD